MSELPQFHGTTIVSVRKGGQVVVAGDGQVTMGQTVMKPNAKKVRRLGPKGDVIGGFAGATADAFPLFERLEAKLERHPGQLMRAAVELAKDWRSDRYLRRLEAMMIVADTTVTLVNTGNGDVLEPAGGIGAGSYTPLTLPTNRKGENLVGDVAENMDKEEERVTGAGPLEASGGDVEEVRMETLAKVCWWAP